jgi:SAM-dependent methyltransferase
VADIGCGYGLSTMTMAAAFPVSRFLGMDGDTGSIFRARRVSAGRRLLNVEWRAEPAHQLPRDRKFGLVCAFDCIHDRVDPKGTLRAIRAGLAEASSCGRSRMRPTTPSRTAIPSARRFGASAHCTA